MAKRKYSIRHRKRKNNRSNTKRGGVGTPPVKAPTLYDYKTGKKITPNISFLNPDELLTKKKSSDIKYNWEDKNGLTAKEVFDKQAGFFTDEAINSRKRDAAMAEFNKLTEDYKKITDDKNNKPSQQETACENGKGCTIMGGRKSRRRKRKTKQSHRCHYCSKR